MYQYKLESQIKDRLVFVHSELSPHYYSSARFKAAFFQRESEPISKGLSYFHGTGRFNVFHIIHPSPDLRVMIDFTRTSLGVGRTLLPAKAIVVGDDDYKIPFSGAGSSRVFTPIIKPEYYEGQAYITLDFGDPAEVINKKKNRPHALVRPAVRAGRQAPGGIHAGHLGHHRRTSTAPWSAHPRSPSSRTTSWRTRRSSIPASMRMDGWAGTPT